MAQGRLRVVAWSFSVSSLAGGFAAFVWTHVRSPLHNPLFQALAVIAGLAFVILVASGLPDLDAWATSLVEGHRPPFPLVTRWWDYTADGTRDDLTMLSGPLHADLPGQCVVPEEDEEGPACVCFVAVVACTPPRRDSEISTLFGSFLQLPIIAALTESMTHVPQAWQWIEHSDVGADGTNWVLAPAENADGVAAARLLLPWGPKSDWRARRCATLILHVVPQDESGQPATPATPYDWAVRVRQALELPRALAAFLSAGLGCRVTGEPSALLAVYMQARDMTELVDIGGLASARERDRRNYAFGCFVGSLMGDRPWPAARVMIRHMLGYALGLDAHSLRGTTRWWLPGQPET